MHGKRRNHENCGCTSRAVATAVGDRPTDALAAFDTLKTQPREAIIDGKTARASLRTEFAELGTLLQDRLLRQLRKYERRAPAFYARVVAARQVVDRPGAATAGTASQL